MQQARLRSNGPWSVPASVVVAGSAALLIHQLVGLAAALAWVGIAAAGAWTVARQHQRAREDDLAELRDTLEALEQGDLERRFAFARLGECAPAGAALNRVGNMLMRARERMLPLGTSLGELPEQVGDAIDHVRSHGEAQQASIEETASLHASLDASIHSIQDEVENLASANEESSASILELGSCSNEVARSAEALRETVTSSTVALHLLGESVQSAAGNANSVEEVAEETAAAAVQMNQTVHTVATHVQGAAELTGGVTQRAEEGSAAVGSTIDGIQEIRAVTHASREALEGLVGGIDQIGEIATVIRSITDETNLLSLNASIIASQAGEHGRAFAVVANQVKELARRTSQNTEQIDSLIRDVQARSTAALHAMAGGMKAVDQGVARSRAAGEALNHIRTAAREASDRVAEIARASDEQERSSQSVAEAARRTSEHVREITGALTEQASSAEGLLENAGRSVQMCQQMASATEEQRAACRDIAANGEAISERIKSIQHSTADHTSTSQQVTSTLAALFTSAQDGAASLPGLAEAIEELRQHERALTDAMGRFEAGAASAEDQAPGSSD